MLIREINYEIYEKLIHIFLDVSNIYKISNNKILFQNIICSNKTFIPKKVFLNLVSYELKENAELIYMNLINQNIKIIPISSNNYPRNLLNINNPPLVIFSYGDILLNEKKSIYVYNKNFSDFGKKVYKYFNYYITGKLLKLGKEDECDIMISKESIFNENYINVSTKNRIIIPYDNIKFKIILGIVDYLFLIEAQYNEETKNIVNFFVESGKEILVVPGNIFNRNHYFTNYLIQEGATVIINKLDFDKFI